MNIITDYITEEAENGCKFIGKDAAGEEIEVVVTLYNTCRGLAYTESGGVWIIARPLESEVEKRPHEFFEEKYKEREKQLRKELKAEKERGAGFESELREERRKNTKKVK